MLRGKRIVSLLSVSLLFTYPTVQTPFHTLAEQSIEKQIDLNGMGQIQDYRLKKLQEQIKKDKIELEKRKAEEEAKRQKEIEEQKKSEPQWQEFILTFYSSSISENSKAGAVTCQGKKLQPYMIANNVYSLGTQIYLEGYGTKIVSDRGSNKHFNTSNRLDVYVEKESDESYSQYIKRVNDYGVKKVHGYIIQK